MGKKLKDILAKVSIDPTVPAFYLTTDDHHHGIQLRVQIGEDLLLMIDEAVLKSTLGFRNQADVVRQGLIILFSLLAETEQNRSWGAHLRAARKAHISIRRAESQHQTNLWVKNLEAFMSNPQTTEEQRFDEIAELYCQFKQEAEEDPVGSKLDIKALEDRWARYIPQGFSFKHRTD